MINQNKWQFIFINGISNTRAFKNVYCVKGWFAYRKNKEHISIIINGNKYKIAI